MRIVVHDYSGHPFQVQLSRELARREHEVLHLYSANFLTPHGNLRKQSNDPETFFIKPVYMPRVNKYAYFKRYWVEYMYAWNLRRRLADYTPDVVISSNMPLFHQKIVQNWCLRHRKAFVFWLQDIYSVAITHNLTNKFGLLGKAIGRHFQKIEAKLLRSSSANVLITDAFWPTLRDWGVEGNNTFTIENWAPLEELPPYPRQNEWSKQHGLDNFFVFLYSGTLGLKHGPELLVQLSKHFRTEKVKIVVVSEGSGIDYIRREIMVQGIENLEILPFQPFKSFSKVLSSADVLVAILNPKAGEFSVPSKVLTYHCIGRPLLLSVPEENLASRIVQENNTGLVTDVNDLEAFLRAARGFYMNYNKFCELGANARKYAEVTFNIKKKGDQFENIINRCCMDLRQHACRKPSNNQKRSLK